MSEFKITPDDPEDDKCASDLEKIINFISRKAHNLCLKERLIPDTIEYWEAWERYMPELLQDKDSE